MRARAGAHGFALSGVRSVLGSFSVRRVDDLAVGAVVGRLTGWLPGLMPDRERAAALVAALTDRFGGRNDRVTAAACTEIEGVAWAYSRHLMLIFEPGGTEPPDTDSRGWPPEDPAAVRRRAGAVSAVRRLPDGTCVIRIDGLEPAAVALPYVDAAFTLAHSATRVVVDLRANGGGDPATVAAIAGWLLGDEPAHLSDVHYPDRVRQWWTPARPAGTALPADLPAVLLVGPGTFSSAEALAYHLRVRRRVTIVGERTPGGADHVTPVRLAPTVLGLLPEARVVDARTGTNWEGGGVRPDLACPAAHALTVACAPEFRDLGPE